MNTIGYYPGCSLHGGGRELDMSIRAISVVAGVVLKEIDDWSCCGATAAHSLNHDLAVSLPQRVLALAEAQGFRQVLAPCAACFSRLKGTHVRLQRSEALAQKTRRITGLEYRGTLEIVNVVEYANRLLTDGLDRKLSQPLRGLKVAAYYGCLLSRGEGIIENEDPEDPKGMDAVLRASGVEVVPWSHSIECCGAGFSMSLTDAVLDLSRDILAQAQAAGAQAIVTGCPMCHSNLDMRQQKINSRGLGSFDMPIMYLSELIGLAAGLTPESLGLDRHFVDAMRVAGRNR